MDGMFASPGGHHQQTALPPPVQQQQHPPSDPPRPESSSADDSGAPESLSPTRGSSPDDQDMKEENRKAAHRVLGKQG